LQNSPNFYTIADWSTRATRAVQAKWRILIGPETHMAAYIRLCTVQVRGGPFNSSHITINRREISLSCQLDQNHIQKEIEEQFINPNRFLQGIQGESMEFFV